MFKTAYEAALEGLGHLLLQAEAREAIRSNAARVIARTADDLRIASHGSGSSECGTALDVKTKRFLKTPGLGLEGSVGQVLDLELPLVGGKLLPPAYTTLVHAERGSDGGLSAIVAENVRGLHDR